MPKIDKVGTFMKGVGADESGGPAPPTSMEQDTEQWRAQVEALPPGAKTDLILDLLQNVTTEEAQAALSHYSAPAGPDVAGDVAGGGMV